MPRYTGSYASIIKGVSQQVPAHRLDGQMGAQVNLISDPAAGLVRRHGSVYLADHRLLPSTWGGVDTKPPRASSDSMRVFEFRQGEQDYTLIYSNKNVSAAGESGMVQVYDKANKTLLPVRINSTDSNLKNMLKWGITSATQVGEYLVMAPNISKGTKTRTEPNKGTSLGSVWFKNTTYNRTYSVSAVVNGVTYRAEYITPSATYAGVLDTSDIMNEIIVNGYDRDYTLNLVSGNPSGHRAQVISPSDILTIRVYYAGTRLQMIPFSAGNPPGEGYFSYNDGWVYVSTTYTGSIRVVSGHGTKQTNPNYAKQLNDRVNAHNSAVTQWIRTSAEQSTPAYVAATIANRLRTAMGAAAQQVIVPTQGVGNVAIEAAGMTDLTAQDGTGGDTVLPVHRRVYSVDELPAYYWRNTILEVRAKDSPDKFYMKSSGPDVFGKVTWGETASVVTTPAVVFLLGHISNGAMCLGSTPAILRGLIGAGSTLPDYASRTAGDEDSAPDPYFLERSITHLDTFQDRLVVVSGNAVSMSAVGDYFRFYPNSVVTVADNDPLEISATGAETDSVRAGVRFDKGLILFGTAKQYALDGRQLIKPGQASMVEISAHEDAVDTSPILVGDTVFFARTRDGMTRVSNMTYGNVAESLRAEEITSPFKDWIGGSPLQLLGVTSPNYVVVRSSGDRSSIHLYRYLTSNGEGIFQSWFQFKYSEHFGKLTACTSYEDKIILFFYKEYNGNFYLSAYEQSLSARLSTQPYLDGLRPYSWQLKAYNPNTMLWDGNDFISCALDSNSSAAWQGEVKAYDKSFGWYSTGYRLGYNKLKEDYPAIVSNHLWAGIDFSGWVELTSPFRRDRNGVAITNGRFTVSRLDVSYAETSGFNAEIISGNTAKTVLKDTGRRMLGGLTSTKVELNTGSVPLFIGRESRAYVCRLYSLPYRPFNITSVEFSGQYFGG